MARSRDEQKILAEYGKVTFSAGWNDLADLPAVVFSADAKTLAVFFDLRAGLRFFDRFAPPGAWLVTLDSDGGAQLEQRAAEV